MKKLMLSGLIIAAMLSGVVGNAADNSADRLNARVHDVNDAARKKGMMDVALHTISVETGVPREQINALHKRFSEAGPGALMISCVMADLTKKAPEEFLKQHSSGDGWGTIAKKNNAPIDKLIERLDHLERAMTTDANKGTKEKR